MKRVALFTTFAEAQSGYSLIAVAETQIKMLLDHGYEPGVLVQDNFQYPDAPSIWRPETIDIREVLPTFQLTEGVAENFEERVREIYIILRENLADFDVCITQDIILQTFFKEYNVAMRQYARERPDLLFLHWIHSRPSVGDQDSYPDNCRFTPPPGYIIYPNDSDKALVVGAYGLAGREWKVKVSRAGHTIDPLAIWPYDNLTKDLISKFDLCHSDISVVYPARLDRGKQPEKIIRLLAGVKKLGYVPRLLIVDWQSMGKRFQTYIDELLKLAKQLDLEKEVAFTSRLDDRCSQGVPRQIVMELMDLTNVYMHPSRAETYSFVVHEAMLKGCLCVLNHDLSMMRELYGDSAIYMDFGSDRVNRTYKPDEQMFWNDEAKRLIAELAQNRTLMARQKARKEWSPQALWREMEPLLYLVPVGE